LRLIRAARSRFQWQQFALRFAGLSSAA
jgi:hypothetical protein